MFTKRHAYLVNFWSDGTRKFASATNGMAARREMKRLAAAGDKTMQMRNQLLDHRVPEELFNYAKDPDALNNLIADPELSSVLNELQDKMVAVMTRSQDPTLAIYNNRHDLNAVQSYLNRLDRESKARKADARYSRSGKAKTKKPKKPSKKRSKP